MVLIHSLKVSTEHALSFVMCYGTIVCDNTGTTPNTLYMKSVNKKYAHNYVCYLTHGRLGAQRKAENRNTGLQRKLKHSLALCKQPVVNSSVILHLQKISDDELFSSYILVQQTTYNARL